MNQIIQILVVLAGMLIISPAQAGTLMTDDTMADHAPLGYHFQPTADVHTELHLAALSDTDHTVEQPDTIEPHAINEPFGTKGTARINMHGGFGIDAKDSDNTFALVGVGYSYFIKDDFAIVVELNGMYFDQLGPNATGVNVQLLLRYHFFNNDTWTIFFDGGVGLLFTDNEVPNRTATFNFTPQAGFGVTYDIGSNNRLIAGVRWYHISNANTDPFNPGRDHAYVYAGLSVPF